MKPHKSLSIVIPTLDEEKNIPLLVQALHNVLEKNGFKYEIIVVDDNSSDGTMDKLVDLSDDYPIRAFLKNGKKGKAQSLIQGFAEAKNPTIVMIDADLQYSPEYIPEMFRKMEDENLDIVVANRVDHETGFLRKFISKSFLTFFVRFLHGLKVDSQSGLKMFKKELLESLTLKTEGWAFDLDFLVQAKRTGARIGSVPIVFYERANGEAKVNLVQASWQIGKDAMRLYFSGPPVIPHSKVEVKEHGHGFTYKGARFVHHTELDPEEMAVSRFGGSQIKFIVIFLLLLVVALYFNWHLTILLIFCGLTFLYFADLLFNMFLIFRSFTTNSEIKISQEQINSHKGEWPIYTVFCPLYKEWQVVPQFVRAMSQLDYPKDKLQIMLLLEEDDKETIAKTEEFDLPDYFNVVVVPHSMPKTKPKALNYGLHLAIGEFITIYDAEDMPDPLQLKKAVLAFEIEPKNTICVQAKLNFYNPHQNILTRVFSAEYSLWFDLVLPGMQSIAGPIPLGGTSNHFRKSDVEKLKGWDAFNVTEDCDLGIRLAKQGYRTAIIESTTMEEANSKLWNWVSQRSRWIKGYIQTYLVHMRNPKQFIDVGKGYHLFAFQLVVGGKILSMFINPLMWCITIIYFIFRAHVAVFIESFFPDIILYIGVFSFVFGNFLYVYYYMIACAKRGYFDLIKYVFLVPFYWLMMSLAAWRAVYEMIVKPHYWAKTLHGLHLKNEKQTAQPRGIVNAVINLKD